MDQLARLMPYVWRHRRRVYLSILFALLVAGLWTSTLSMTFLVVKVLLQGQSLEAYVENEIQAAHVATVAHEKSIAELQRRIEEFRVSGRSASNNSPAANQPVDTEASLLKLQDRERRKSTAAFKRLDTLRWVNSHGLGWIPRDQFDTYALILGALALATILKGIAAFVQEMLVGSVVELSVRHLRQDCFRRALELDYQTLSLRGTPELMSRFTNDIGTVASGLNLMGGHLVREPLKAMACIVAAFCVNWQLTLLSLVFVPLMAAVFHRYGQLLKRASHQMMDRMSRIYKSLQESFDGMKIVIAYHGAPRHRQRFHRENKDYYRQAMRVVRIDALTGPTTELLATLAVCVSLLPGAYLVLRQKYSIWGVTLTSELMEIEELAVLYAFLLGVLDPVRRLSSVYTKMKRAAAATERVLQIRDWKSLLKESDQPVALPRHSQSVAFKKIGFRYATLTGGAERPEALDEVTLKVPAGEVVVIVGENGSGKSTLVNLLPRYYDPDRGAVLIDGIDIRQARLRDLRGQIGVVTQETLLFDDTIYENIRYGQPYATHEQIVAAAENARVPQFFDQLPQGYQTHIGPRGSRLSGGQRQRVALARALVRDPSILILDEATSAVDAQSESLIHQCLGDFIKGRTVFLITHSVTPRILEFATRIVIMEQGRLLADGPHDELLQACPAYHRLFNAQAGLRTADSNVEIRLDPAAAADDSTTDGGDSIDAPHLIRFIPADEAVTKDSANLREARRQRS